MSYDVNWTNGEAHMVAAHGVTVAQTNEALADPASVEISPDYNSKSGDSIRIIGWSESFGDLLSVIVVRHDRGLFGATGWRSNDKDRAIYEGEESCQ